MGNGVAGYYLESKDNNKLEQKHDIIHVSFGTEEQDETLYYSAYEDYKQMFDFFITNNHENILNILLLSYTHKFHNTNMKRYVDELFYLYQLSCRIPITPNPLCIFLVEAKLYYYVLGNIKKELKNEEINLNITTNDIILPTITTITYKSMYEISQERYKKLYEKYMEFIKEQDIYSKIHQKKFLKFGWSGNNSCVIDLYDLNQHTLNRIKNCSYSQVKHFQQATEYYQQETKVYKIGDMIHPLKPSAGYYRNNNRISNTPEHKL